LQIQFYADRDEIRAGIRKPSDSMTIKNHFQTATDGPSPTASGRRSSATQVRGFKPGTMYTGQGPGNPSRTPSGCPRTIFGSMTNIRTFSTPNFAGHQSLCEAVFFDTWVPRVLCACSDSKIDPVGVVWGMESACVDTPEVPTPEAPLSVFRLDAFAGISSSVSPSSEPLPLLN
jgi:hypothetical protein